MAVVAVWKCDRDGAMFDNKKDAEEHDNMLELAANITSLIEKNIPKIDESMSEEIGLLLARRREALAKACKGKPEVLLEEDADQSTTAMQNAKSAKDSGKAANTDATVTPLVAKR